MKRAAIILCVLTLMLGGTASVVYAEEIQIVIHPSVINMNADLNWVVVYAFIPFSVVEEDTVLLNDIPAANIKESDRGYLVAKFRAEKVKASVSPGIVTLTLSGETTSGDFWGEDTILVKNIGGGN